MWIQRAYAAQIEEAMEPLLCDLTSHIQPGDMVVTCSNGDRSLKFIIEMNQDPQQFVVKVSYTQEITGKSPHLGQVDPFHEQLNTLANWLKVTS